LLLSYSAVLQARRVVVYQQSVASNNHSVLNVVQQATKDSATSGSSASSASSTVKQEGTASTPGSSTKEMVSIGAESMHNIEWLLFQQRSSCNAFEMVSRVSKLSRSVLADYPSLQASFDCVPFFCPDVESVLTWAYSTARSLEHLFPSE